MKQFEEFLVASLAELLEVGPSEISVTQPLGEQGVDSLIVLRLARKIQDRTGEEFEPEWILDQPTITQLAGFLDQRSVTVKHISI